MIRNHKTGGLFSVVALISTAFLFGFSSSLEASPRGDGGLSIVKVISHTGKLDFEIVEADLVGYLKKDVEEEYKKAKKEWSAAKSEWKEKHGKIPFAYPEPLRPVFKVIAKGLESQSQAKIEMEALRSQGPFCIIQVMRGEEKDRPQVVLMDEVDLKKFDLELGYHEKVVAWTEEKAAFEAAEPNGSFEKPLPEKPRLKVLKNSLKTYEKASAYLSKYVR